LAITVGIAGQKAFGFVPLPKGRTVIVITHRFAAARLADQIHLWQMDVIVESGTHDQLIVVQGHYETRDG